MNVDKNGKSIIDYLIKEPLYLESLIETVCELKPNWALKSMIKDFKITEDNYCLIELGLLDGFFIVTKDFYITGVFYVRNGKIFYYDNGKTEREAIINDIISEYEHFICCDYKDVEEVCK